MGHVPEEICRMNSSFPWPFIIPVIAIIGGLGIAGLAIFTEHRRRQALLDERRLMIEKGMTPPPLSEQMLAADPQAGMQAWSQFTLDSSLRSGIATLFAGLGLIAAFLVLRFVVPGETFLSDRVVAMTGPAGALVALIGVGNLVYYRIVKARSAEPSGSGA